MAAIKATVAQIGQRQDQAALSVTWAGVTENDTFVAMALFPDYPIKSVHFSGTFGGATVVVKGSNTGTNFFGLTDPQGVAISVTSEGLKQIQENVAQYQPVATGGSSQSLTVTMVFSRSQVPRG